MQLTSSDSGQTCVFLCFVRFFSLFLLRCAECRTYVVVEKRFVVAFSVFSVENCGFGRLFKRLFNRHPCHSQPLLPGLSTGGGKTEFPFHNRTFFCMAADLRNLSTDFSTKCGKHSPPIILTFVIPSVFHRASCDISVTKRRHLDFFALSSCQKWVFFSIFRLLFM